jgi:ABC-type Fe3+ transport system substrate-binding protein
MSRRSLLIVLTAAVAILPFLGGAASPARAADAAVTEPKTIDALVDAVKHEGQTATIAWADTMYGGGTGTQRFQDGINRKYHLDLHIEFTPLSIPGGAFESQIAQEVKAGQTASSDILFNVYQAPEAAYMQAVDWRDYVPNLPEDTMFFDHRAVGMVGLLEGIIYNTKLIPADKVPHTLAELLEPQWKGKLSTSPYQGIEGSYLGLPEALGKEGMLNFYTAFAKQLGGVMRCGSEDRIVSGEFLMFGIDCGDFSARMAQRKGMPLAMIYPKEGAGLYFLATGIPQTAAHPYAARLLIAYMLSREGQDILWDVMGTDNYKVAGSHMGDVIADARKANVKIIEAFGADVQHPELTEYDHQIDALVNQPR